MEARMAPPPPELMGELVEEILVRLPPDDPASLASAALVSKLWCRLVCGAAFRRRFREFHFHRGAAPLLGLLYDETRKVRGDNQLEVAIAYFVPTTSLRPAHAAAAGRYGWRAMDARHGRVLLYRKDDRHRQHGGLCVWDPVTDEHQHLPMPPFHVYIAAVACAATAANGGDCDHLDCSSHGHFLVVVMRVLFDDINLAVYSSEAGVWSEVTICQGPTRACLTMFNSLPGILLRSALYILVHYYELMTCGVPPNHVIVKYDWATRQMSMIQLPSKFCRWKHGIMVMTDDDGGLGFVANVKNKLQLWSRVAEGAGADDGDAGFVLTRVIDLRKVLPSDAFTKKKPQVNDFALPIKKKLPQVNGFADGGASRILFIRTFDDALYSIDMNSNQVKKLDNCCGNDGVVPYISFCTPTSRVQH